MTRSSRQRKIACAAAVLVCATSLAPLATSPASASNIVVATIPITSPSRPDPVPVDVAVDTDTNQAYVANSFEGTVSVIDTTTNRLRTTVPNGPTSIGLGPSGVAADQLHHQVYVANYNSHTVSVIDTRTNSVTKVIPYDPARGIGKGPNAIAVDSSLNRAYIGNLIDGTVSVVDTLTNSVIKVLPHDSTNGIGRFVLDAAIDTALHRAYVTNNQDNSVSVIDTQTDTVLTVITADPTHGIGKAPRQIAVDQVAHRAFVTNSDVNTVSVIDTRTNAVTSVIPFDRANGIGEDPDSVEVDQSNGLVYVATEAQISVIDTSTLRVTRIVKKTPSADFGKGIQGIAMDPTHRRAYVTGSASNTVAVLDLDASVAVARRGGADRFVVSAANSAAEFATEAPVVYVASGSGFADALSGSAAAGAQDAPVLLVATDSIPTVIGLELARLRPKRIVVLGGVNSVSAAVERELTNYAPAVDRLGGADRYVVSAAVSKDGFDPGVPVAYLASGETFPDALSGAAVAAFNDSPVLLTAKGAISAAVSAELDRLKPARVVILGGTNTIATSVEQAVAQKWPTTRIGGTDRFAVSAALSYETYAGNIDVAYISSGLVFPDALSGAPAAAVNGAPVLLVTADGIPASVSTELDRLHPHRIVVLGGPATISDAVLTQLRTYVD